MTLLELLRQEKFEWPGNIVKIHQDYDGQLWGWDTHGSEKYLKTLKHIADNARKFGARENMVNMVTREQYEAAAQQPVWNGEGLPPVGCECEHCSYSGVVTVVQIIAHFKNRAAMVAAYIPVEGDVKQVQQSVADCFRPLRTEAERAIDEMVRLSGVSIGAAKILYDAGYRKG